MMRDLRLQSFRSYQDASFEFSEGVNIVVGPNASGKTNLLEAILVLARGNSYRVKDADLIAFEQPWARLDADDEHGGKRTLKLIHDAKNGRPTKRYEIDGKPFQRLSLQHSLPVVLFEPNHLQLLSGSPERRRDYLDDLLEQTQTGYGQLRRQYRRTLAQRNALLKQPATPTSTQLFPWNIRLSQVAGQVVRARHQLLIQLQATIPDLYQAISRTKTVIELSYTGQWPPEMYETNMLHKLENSVELDRMRGFTSAGPHRDDFQILFDDHPAADSASRGEARTLVLSLKIFELQLLSDSRTATPILLLDDVFSELDGSRRKALTEHLKNYQTFITTTDADIVLEHFTETCNVIPLST